MGKFSNIFQSLIQTKTRIFSDIFTFNLECSAMGPVEPVLTTFRVRSYSRDEVWVRLAFESEFEPQLLKWIVK